MRPSRVLLLSSLAGALACAAPVGVERIDPAEVHRELTANVLSRGVPGAFSQQVLTREGLSAKYRRAPEDALATLHAELAPTGDDDRLFALAELSFHHGERTGLERWYAASVIYAWAFLFPGEAGSPPERSDPRTRLAFDLYNRALTAGMAGWRNGELVPGVSVVQLPFGSLQLETPGDLRWAGQRLTRFVPAADFSVRGLSNRYRRPGLGAPLTAEFESIEADDLSGPDRWVGDRGIVPLTAVVLLPEARRLLSSGDLVGTLRVYTADVSQTVSIDGADVPLEFEVSSAVAHTLSERELWDFSLRGFFSGGYQLEDADHQLRMLNPWIPGRVPVVLVHGTASNPGTWAELVNELLNDRRLAQRIQLWLFQYNTGNPIFYSAGILREQLTEAVAELDPNAEDPALRRMVVIGHSQGGLLTRLTATDSGTAFWDRTFKRLPQELGLEPDTLRILERSLLVESLPFVERVIFISTPHRGSYLAAFRLANLVSSLVKLPTRLVGLSVQLLTLDGDALALRRIQRLPTSVDNMRPGSAFLDTLETLPIAPGIHSHSIIPVKGDAPPDGQSDGVVRYESAHLDGVDSEKIVYHSEHSTQGTPEAILEVKRILLEQLDGASGGS
jgi:pimeloyl-ACP methyl ester carboxylesterase